MIRILTTAFLAATLTSALAADAKEEVTKAAKALVEKGNYSWKTTVVSPGSQFNTGPTQGKADKDVMYVTMTFRDNETEAYIKGDKGGLHRSKRRMAKRGGRPKRRRPSPLPGINVSKHESSSRSGAGHRRAGEGVKKRR